MDYKLKAAGVSAFALMIVAIATAVVTAGNATECLLTILVLALGGTFGWFIGILSSPYSAKEGERFNQYAKTLSAFVSGYLLSTFSKLIQSQIDSFNLADPVVAARVLGFAVCLLVGIIATYGLRAYTA